MRSILSLVLALGSVAPLAAQVSVPVPPTKMTNPALRNVPPRILVDTMGTPYEVNAPAGRVYTALLRVYAEDLKIKAELSDSSLLQVGNLAFNARGTLGGRRVSAFLECGSGMTGDYADAYPIYVSLVSFIQPVDANRASVRTALIANAYNVTEGARPIQNCWSNGEFESRVSKLVIKKLAQ